MKILLLNQHFYPEIAATSQLATDLAEDLVNSGFAVTVVTGFPSYEENSSMRKIPAVEEYKKIKIYRVWTTAFYRHSKVGRIINYLSFYFSAFCKLLFLPRYIAIVAMSTPPYLALLGVFLKIVKGTHLIFWLQDVYPDLAVGFGVIREKSLITRILKKLSQLIYRKSTVIVAIGNTMKTHLLAEGVPEEKIVLIDNWADPNDFSISPTIVNPIREKFNLEKKFVFVYSGNMGIVHDFNLLQKAMLECKDQKNLNFFFIGEGKKKQELQKWCMEHTIANVYFLPYQPREMLRYSMRMGDVALITQDPRSVGLVVPSKFYGFIAAGRPILAIAPENSELYLMIKKYQCGICVENNNWSNLFHAIMKFQTDAEFYQNCSQNSQKAFHENFSRLIATSKFAGIFQKLNHYTKIY